MSDNVAHPPHYLGHQSGIECIQVVEHMNFNLGNVMKYCWRCDKKNGIEDLRKAAWYLDREIKRREREQAEIDALPVTYRACPDCMSTRGFNPEGMRGDDLILSTKVFGRKSTGVRCCMTCGWPIELREENVNDSAE